MKKPNTQTIELMSSFADMASTFAALYVALRVYQTTSSVLKAFAAFLCTGCALVVLLAVVLKVTMDPKEFDDVFKPPH